MNATGNRIGQHAWRHREFAQFRRHKLTGWAAGERFGLSIEMSVDCPVITALPPGFGLEK